MARRNSLACILFLILWLFYTVMASSAAVLELKTGQKVEGDYAGGSATEIKLKVGSQILVFPVQDVSRLHFIAPASEGDFSGDCLKALRVLKGLQSVTKAGIALTDYAKRVSDARVEIDDFIDRYKGKEGGQMLTQIGEAMDLYTLAFRIWSPGSQIATEEDFRRCPQLQHEKSATMKLSDGDMLYSQSSIPLVWSCANERVTRLAESMREK